MSTKTAVVLFNMGGPDRLQSVRPFLRNLFADPAIIGLPKPFRYLLAEFISRVREKEAQKNYALMGGKSPIEAESEKQRLALQSMLEKEFPDQQLKCFLAMRYWGPGVDQAQREIKNWGANKIILLPLYPQFSTTTTGSFFTHWQKHDHTGLPVQKISSYETDPAFIDAHVEAITAHFSQNGAPPNIRVIMSAHGLPEKIIAAGDPYQRQIEASCAAIKDKLPNALQDMKIAYQSRVGPLKWIGPSTLDGINRAANEKKGVLIVPIAFVSEHIETLVELDIDYRKQAESMGIKTYLRVPALGIAPSYIHALSEQVKAAMKEK
ncbi:MAG: ferrochelatase [Robiginitomaculum sp.]|nr:MAG: ferrochelatase [Robiginitomaculum sp.]